jgi:hypothetical protein
MLRDWAHTERWARARLAATPDDPRLQVLLGTACLGQGRYAEGFELLHARWRVPNLQGGVTARLPVPEWRGEDVTGKRLLVCSSDGLGDQIMSARFARMLAQRGADVQWLCPPSLARLFSRCLGVAAFPTSAQADLGRVDAYVISGDLAGWFFPPLTEPPSEPYLRHPQPQRAPGLNLGVMTRGNPAHENDANRSLPADLARELLAMSGAVDLSPANTGAQDFYDTASILSGLDLVITVDTSVAHLAGALGVPVWILLPAVQTDWRWQERRTDSPWYASARLFRQGPDRDWRSVLEAVKAAYSARSEAAE